MFILLNSLSLCNEVRRNCLEDIIQEYAQKSIWVSMKMFYFIDQEPLSIKKTYKFHKMEIINSFLKSKISEKNHSGKVFLDYFLLGGGAISELTDDPIFFPQVL